MNLLPDRVKRVYLRLIEPVAEWLIRNDVQPNTITTIGTLCSVIGGIIYGTGHIRTGGWFLGLTALFDVLDGMVARRTNRSSLFGAFYDSTLDRVADGFVLGGLAVFFSTRPGWQGTVMVAVCVLALIGAFVTSYTRARAEALGIDAKVGLLQRPERVILLSAPQAFFGLALDGLVQIGIIVLLTITAWVTALQRVAAVRGAARREHADATRAVSEVPIGPESAREAAPPRSIVKGE
ncbi:MAG TPA: CDP-alcohol phosphatidyltransferase family protein [Gemmatimonadaceae bacterium]|nr:CDP-alcohol phosphatidyltransferase family protein [Gemmatimonadaceae bacterium]